VPFYFPGGALPLKKNIYIFFFSNLLAIYDTSSIRETPNVLKLKGKHFIDPKRRERKFCPQYKMGQNL
jgi:hypothetical protein